MIADSRELRELCARVAREQDPVKLRELIAELSLLLQADEESEKSESSAAENRSKKNRQNPTI